ncbi:phage integrase family protein [Hydrogenophaga sp. RAC07]|uniref:tyrosine-type recombinase/integrase n=1 Tax=Hydrogenophaga sp. RAC07 TaxID=1842537 RepID=UPI00083CA6C8|nr:integrase family protein [Hydrogenophaga sp. RAC07]AOF83926.1 phage integrase family protein [Hydrogenophaga sp. RAC07]
MSRPSKLAAIDFAEVHQLTHGLLERATCPAERPFVLVKDADKKGLRLRVTKAGGKHWQFETRLRSGKLFTRALGEWPTISIADARSTAHQLRGQTELGADPRIQEREQAEHKAATKAAAVAQALTVGEVWPLYLANGKPKRRDAWKPRYRADLETMAAPGGVPKKRGEGVTRPGPLFPLLALPLAGVNEDSLKCWFDSEAVKGKHQATRALMMFRGFLRWCSSRPEYRKLTDREAGRAAAIVESLPTNTRRTDALEAAQVPGWWAGVVELQNLTASAYLRALLLTGARREELAALKWTDVDFQWRKLTLADKVDATRTIPLTPYMAWMLASLPRINEHVFASSSSKAGRIADARGSHQKVLKSAGVEVLTIHGLRRSFSLLGESAGAPAGAIAQVMGHKPSATAEGYRPRSTDALRPYLELIEVHILEHAGVKFEREAEPGKLRAVAG